MASFEADASDGRDAVFLRTGVLAGCAAEALVRGVPSMVDMVFLKLLIEPRSSRPALDPGRLPALEETLPEPSEL